MKEATGGRLARRTTACALGVLAVLVLASSGAVANGDLDVSVEAWCPPQLDGCMAPDEDPCASYAEVGRWMGLELEVTKTDGDPAPLMPVYLNYTEHRGDGPVDRSKAQLTDEAGQVSFSLRNATDVTLETRHDGQTHELSPTWGTVHVDPPASVPTRTVGEEHAPGPSYAVRGYGPSATPPGTVTFSDPTDETRSFTFDATDGTLEGTLTSEAAGTVTYTATGTDICGLPPAEDAGFAMDWLPGSPTAIEITCETQSPAGGSIVDCRAHGVDVHGNEVGLRDVGWDAEMAFPDPNAGFWSAAGAGDAGPEISFLTPTQGSLTLDARHGNLSANHTLLVQDEQGPVVTSLPEEARAGQPIPIRIEDASGIERAQVTYEGHTLDSVEADGAETLTLEPTFRTAGEFTIRVYAEETGSNTPLNESITLTVLGSDHVAGANYGSSSSSSSSSTSSSSSSSSSSSTAGSEEPASPPSSPVEAQPASEGVLEANVELEDGRTPLVRTPDGDLSAQVTSSSHRELVVQLRPESGRPAQTPGTALRTFDVSVSTPNGYQATIDEAQLTVDIAADDLEAFDVEADDLELFHWTNERWEQVDVDTSADEDRVRLSGTVSSLSPFTVTVPDAETENTVIELEAEGALGELPATYRGEASAAQAGSTIHARTTDGVVSFDFDVGEPGDHVFEVEVHEVPGPGLPGAVTEEGRYVDVTIVGPDGREQDVGGAEGLSLTLDPSQLGGDGGNLVPVTVDRDEWRPLEGTVARSEGKVTVTTQARQPLMGVLADGRAPRVGLQDPLPETLVGEVGIAVVASDNLAVDRVRVLAEDVVLDEATERPFALTIDADDLTEGTAELRFEAIDRAGNVGETTRSTQVVADEELGGSELGGEASEPTGTPTGEQEAPSVGVLGLAAAVVLALGARARW